MTINWAKPIRFINNNSVVVNHIILGNAHVIYWDDNSGLTHARQLTKNGDSMESYCKLVENIPEEPKNYIGLYAFNNGGCTHWIVNCKNGNTVYMTKTEAAEWVGLQPSTSAPYRKIVCIDE